MPGQQTTPNPYPGYEPHRSEMTEEQNEARNAHNERAWAQHQIDNLIQTNEHLGDQIVANERQIAQINDWYPQLEDEPEDDEPTERNEMMVAIHTAYYAGPNDRSEAIYDESDGYGERGFIPCQGYDWSGIRDSSDEAVVRMYNVVTNWGQ